MRIRPRPTRRQFLQSTGAVAATLWIPLALPRPRGLAAEATSPNARPLVGCIGNGNMGGGDAQAASRHGDVVAFCDVDRTHAEALRQRLNREKAEICEDYRRLLDRKDLSVVTVSTPDHWHAKIAVEAMRAGKDVYCQKPLTLTIDEGKLLCRVVRETGRVLQVGSQQRSEFNGRFLKAVALVRGGRIGRVQRAVCILGTAPSGGPFAPAAPPVGLNWDLWLGPAPRTAYIPQRCHRTFRWWYEYSGGKMTDWGAHHVDIAQWALGMEGSGPEQVEVIEASLPVPYTQGSPTVDNAYNTPTRFRVRCRFAGGVELHICSRASELAYPNGIYFEGTQGRFFVSRGDLEGAPADALEEQPIPTADLVALRKGRPLGSHMGNFFECVADRGTPVSDVFSHHRAMTTCHLANLAIRLGRTLRWDPVREEMVGDTEAQGFLRREPRRGFEVAG